MPADQGFRKRHAADIQAISVLGSDGGRNHLSLLTQKVAAKHFEVYWQRGLNGAPARWSKGVEKCWKLGVAAAIAATQKELRNVCSQTATDEQLLTYMREKAVREHGQVVNGHKFKRPPSAAILAHYAALGEVWQERYGPHYQAGTVPDDIKDLLRAPVTAVAPTLLPFRSQPQPCPEDYEEALPQKRPRTQSNNSQGDMASPKAVLSSVSGGEVRTAWGPPDTDADSSAQDTYLQPDGPYDEACTLPARTGAAAGSCCAAAQRWPFASQQQQQQAANLDLALHAALAGPPADALASPGDPVCHGCLDSMSRACSTRASPCMAATPSAVQACAGHRLLTQRLGQLEADLMDAIQQHRASSAKLVERIARLERHMDSPGPPKLEESCFDFFSASPLFGDLYRE